MLILFAISRVRIGDYASLLPVIHFAALRFSPHVANRIITSIPGTSSPSLVSHRGIDEAPD